MRKIRSTCVRWTAGIAVAVLLGSGAGAGAASASREPVVSDPIVDGLAGPLQFEVSTTGKVLVGQSFSGTVSSIDRKGNLADLFNDPGVDGVSRGAFGTVVYTHTDSEAGAAELRLWSPFGGTTVIADLAAHEAAKNPDAVNS